MNELDHLTYVSDRRYRWQVHTSLRRASDGRLTEVAVLHEGDELCCRLETWDVTAKRVMLALAEDGVRPLWAFEPVRP
jgi:hypothetical protein